MGYDPRATKLPKSVKRIAATMLDNHARRGLIKSYIVAERMNVNARGSRNRKQGD